MIELSFFTETLFSGALLTGSLFTGSLLSAFLLGIMGSGHCLGMCGGISAALGLQQKHPHFFLASYNLGRISTYTTLGAVAGLIGSQITDLAPLLGPWLRTVAGLLLITMGLYIAGWWMGLTKLEQLGSRLWRHIQPLSSTLLPVSNHWQALQLGLLWGLLPCGLVYSILSWALATASWQQSALLMLAFGLGTLPSMLISGYAGKRLLALLRQHRARAIAGLLMIALGLMTIVIPWQHSDHQHSTNSPSSEQNKSLEQPPHTQHHHH